MTFMMVTHTPDRASYDRIHEILMDAVGDEGDGGWPGLIVHAACELPDGTVRVVDIYESREAMEAGIPGIMEAAEKAGIDFADLPRPEVLEVFSLVR